MKVDVNKFARKLQSGKPIKIWLKIDPAYVTSIEQNMPLGSEVRTTIEVQDSFGRTSHIEMAHITKVVYSKK